MSHLIKICGLTSAEDANVCVKAGANLLGLIFVPGTPRFVTLKQAQAIKTGVKKPVKWVGVFQGATLERVQAYAKALSLDFIQLHGDESPVFCKSLAKPVIKTLLLDDDAPGTRVNQYRPLAENNIAYLLADLPKGTSLTLSEALNADWGDALKPVASNLLLAGRLTPETVGGMMETVQAAGVDVASGVEIAPGKKDPEKVQAFCHSVRQAQGRIGVS